MKRFLCIFTILMWVVICSNTSYSQVTPYPDYGPVHNSSKHYEKWRDTIDDMKDNVEGAFGECEDISSELKNANDSIRNTMYGSLPAGIQSNIITSLVSAFSITVIQATNIAKELTLEGAAITIWGVHETKLDTFNNYWDGKGWATWTNVRAKMQTEVNQNGVPGVQADSLMEAFLRYEYALNIYNKQVRAWKIHSPSDSSVTELEVEEPVKPGLSTVGCFNDCGDSFSTFREAGYSHRSKCGTAKDVEIENIEQSLLLGYTSDLTIILRNRTVSEGCGRSYYDCPNKPGDDHNILTCNKWVYYRESGSTYVSKTKCNRQFRKCLGKVFDHNPYSWGSSAHSDEADSNEETASTPSTPPTPSTPTYHACGTHETTVSGNHESAGCGTSGHYACDGNSHASAGCSDSGHYVCDSRSHASAGCGTSGHYDCDEKDHSMQASCLINSSCTVANFYKCQSHTCQATCASGHTYDPRDKRQVNSHRTRTCRFEQCRQTWQKCVVSSTPICNKPYRKKNLLSCWAEE